MVYELLFTKIAKQDLDENNVHLQVFTLYQCRYRSIFSWEECQISYPNHLIEFLFLEQ